MRAFRKRIHMTMIAFSHRSFGIVTLASLGLLGGCFSPDPLARQTDPGLAGAESSSGGSSGAADSDSTETPVADDESPPDDSLPGRLRAELLALLDAGATANDLLPLAQERRDVLREGWTDGETYGPGAFFTVSERASFPGKVMRVLEERVDVQGEVHALITDGAEGSEGDALEWIFDGARPRRFVGVDGEAFAGMRVRIDGWRVDDFVMPLSIQEAPDIQGAVSAEAGVLVLGVKLHPGDTEPDFEGMADLMETGESSIQEMYLDVSNGDQLVFPEDFAGPYSLFDEPPEDAGGCMAVAWADQLDEAARADGIEPSNYDLVQYIFSPAFEDVCGRANGEAMLGGSRSWIYRPSLRTVAHEFGHNFGMYHAGTVDCDSLSLPESSSMAECRPQAYEDRNDFMGRHNYRRLNAAHLAKMGWLDDDEVVSLNAESSIAPGVYSISPLYADAAQTRALRLELPGINKSLYLSYRQESSPFDPLLSGAGRGIEFHLGDASFFSAALEGQAGFNADTAVLERGIGNVLTESEVFWDKVSGLFVRLLDHDEDGATVRVRRLAEGSRRLSVQPQLVADVVVAEVDGAERVLAVYHRPTGLVPSARGFDDVSVEEEHTELVVRLVDVNGTEIGGGLEHVLGTPPSPTAYANRVEESAAAAYDPVAEAFAVVTSRVSHTQNDSGGFPIIRRSLLLHRVSAATGDVTEIGEIDLGPAALDNGAQNPYWAIDTQVDLVWTPSGFVLAYGTGGQVLNIRGKSLALGVFALPAPGQRLDSPASIRLRHIPATSRAKWPELAVGNVAGRDVVALAWTQSKDDANANRIAVLGYDPAQDTFFANGSPAVPFGSSAGLAPLLVADPELAESFQAFRPSLSFDASRGRFTTSYLYNGTHASREVFHRTFALDVSTPASRSFPQIINDGASAWQYGAKTCHANGWQVDVYQHGNGEFFDGLAAINLGLVPEEGYPISDGWVEAESQFEPMALAAARDGLGVYLLRSGTDGVWLDVLRD